MEYDAPLNSAKQYEELECKPKQQFSEVVSCTKSIKKKRVTLWLRVFMEAPPRFELGVKELQSSALPLGYSALLERMTRLELATSTLARWRSTR